MLDLIITHLNNPTLRYILLGVILSTSSTALIGSFWFLQKKSLIGDVISHALLPGICISFLGSSTHMSFYLTLGACITGSLALFLLEKITMYSKIKQDAGMALILSTFLGIGLFLLTYVQQGGHEGQAGLKQFLFGNTATLMREDVWLAIALACILITLTLLFFKAFTLISFDPIFSQAIGWNTGLLSFLIQFLTLLAMVVGMRAMGTLLMASILIIPTATARFWTNHLPLMLILATCLATLASTLGIFLSYAIADLPTGPCMVLCMATFTLLSFFIAPKRGWLSRKYRWYRYQEKMLLENVLKLLYQLGDQDGKYDVGRKVGKLLAKRPMPRQPVQKALDKLLAQGLVVKTSHDTWALTPDGKDRGAHIRHLHTLWEAYLMRHLHIRGDHVHDDAESIEHILTPELEADLRKLFL